MARIHIHDLDEELSTDKLTQLEGGDSYTYAVEQILSESASSSLQMVRIQAALAEQSRTIQMASNILRSRDSTSQNTVRNFRT